MRLGLWLCIGLVSACGGYRTPRYTDDEARAECTSEPGCERAHARLEVQIAQCEASRYGCVRLIAVDLEVDDRRERFAAQRERAERTAQGNSP